MMRVSALATATLILSITLLSINPADARKKRYKKRYRAAVTCQGDHLHYGSSESFKRKRAALNDAIASWRGWTAFEYGDEWANWGLSTHKSVNCSKSTNRLWTCSISSTPCARKRRR